MYTTARYFINRLLWNLEVWECQLINGVVYGLGGPDGDNLSYISTVWLRPSVRCRNGERERDRLIYRETGERERD